MSVNFHVRRLSASILGAVRAEPTLTAHLCDETLDFNPATYAQVALRGVTADRIDAARASLAIRRDRQAAAKEELFTTLEAAGISRDEIGLGLHLGKSWWGMEAMIGAELGARLVVEAEGESIGDDVGYGPARLLSPSELPAIVSALDALSSEAAERRFRVREEEDAAQKKALSLGVPPALTGEEFELWAWQPLLALRDYVRETAAAEAWLLKWYD